MLQIHLHTRPMGKQGEVIIHRDLATRNILLKNGAALVSDFGLSRLKSHDDSAEQTRYDFGPLKWMVKTIFREFS
jgi:tRNA A-37 threonylcarbamoyl transferase component Bud32